MKDRGPAGVHGGIHTSRSRAGAAGGQDEGDHASATRTEAYRKRPRAQGDRNADSVTIGAGLCDAACLKKVLEYVAAIEAGDESAEGWPTMATLSGPNDNTSRFIDAHQQEFEWIATATDGGDGSTQAELRKVLQKWEKGNWQLTR